MTATHARRTQSARQTASPASQLARTPSAPDDQSPGGIRKPSLSFSPYSSLRNAATSDLEGRVTEAISSFRDVARARVLVRPAIESPFADSAKSASALVILGVRDGAYLSGDAIAAIAECATTSGASLQQVRVVSESGQTLFGAGAVQVNELGGRQESPLRAPSPMPSKGLRPQAASGWAFSLAALAGGLAVGFCAGLMLASRRRRGRQNDEAIEARPSESAAAASHIASTSSILTGLTADELLLLVAHERPAVVARLLEGADASVAAVVLQALPEAKRAEVTAVAQSRTRPWRGARAALQRAVAAKQSLLVSRVGEGTRASVAAGGTPDGPAHQG